MRHTTLSRRISRAEQMRARNTEMPVVIFKTGIPGLDPTPDQATAAIVEAAATWRDLLTFRWLTDEEDHYV